MRKNSLLRIASYPELQTLDRLHLPIIRAVKIPLSRADVGVAHQSLNGFKIVPIVQKGSCKGMPEDMRMDSLSDQSLFRHAFDEAINGLWRQTFFLIGTMFPKCREERMGRIHSIPARPRSPVSQGGPRSSEGFS